MVTFSILRVLKLEKRWSAQRASPSKLNWKLLYSLRCIHAFSEGINANRVKINLNQFEINSIILFYVLIINTPGITHSLSYAGMILNCVR